MMWPLLVCSIVGLAVMVERFLYYQHITSLHDKIAKKLNQSFGKKDIEDAYKICRSYTAPLSHILLAGMAKIKQGRESVSNAMDESAIDQFAQIEKRLPILATIASVSTLLGFTGTVIGMIKAFQSIAREGVSSPSVVAGGISTALITTATGLLIAIPVIVSYHYFSHTSDRVTRVIEKSSKELLSVFD